MERCVTIGQPVGVVTAVFHGAPGFHAEPLDTVADPWAAGRFGTRTPYGAVRYTLYPIPGGTQVSASVQGGSSLVRRLVTTLSGPITHRRVERELTWLRDSLE